MKRQTKIVCTLGPAVHSKEKIQALISAGMNVARLNCSHGDWGGKRELIEWIKTSKGGDAVAILADLQGPKFRLGVVADGSMELETGSSVRFGAGDCELPVPSAMLLKEMRTGDRILLGDGYVELKLGPESEGQFVAKVVAGGTVKTKQGITVAGRSFDVPAMTTKDLQDVRDAVEAGVDFIALSYVRTGADMRELRQMVERLDPGIKLCAKVETREALRDIDDIVALSDLVMVARGDLGLQMDTEDVPMAQKKIIRKCNLMAKPVITATQMLESMVENVRPTRAEASDVANAILDGTDAIMLSGETASGLYPIESVKMMVKIAEKAEPVYVLDETVAADAAKHSATDVVAHSAVNIAHGLKCKAIVTTSMSGVTPRMVSKYRPSLPIYCASYNERVRRQLAVVRGVQTIVVDPPVMIDDAVKAAVNGFLREKWLKVGDEVVVTAGVPVGQPGNTNMIQVVKV